MLASLMSGGLSRRERNSISEKPLPAAPSNRPPSQSPVRTEQASTGSPAHRQRPSIVGTNSFQRPKKKVVWKGKTCTILLPADNVKDETGEVKLPLRPEEVKERFASWQRNGLSIRGFDLSDIPSGDLLTGQSCEVYPDHKEFQDAISHKRFTVRIPNKQLWDDYVRQIQEEKLRALGVTLGGEDPPPRAPSVMSQMSRQASSQSLFPQNFAGASSASGLRSPMEHGLSPLGSSPISQYPFPQAMISPNIQPMLPRSGGLHLASQSVAFNRDRVFSPNSLSSHPPSTPGQQYLGSLPSSRGVSPLIDERKQPGWSPQSVSPLPEMLQNGYSHSPFGLQPYSHSQGQFTSISDAITPIPLQQQVKHNLHEQIPAQYHSHAEIASPLPQGRSHRHNVSASLQRDIDEAENSLEASITEQLQHEVNTASAIVTPKEASSVPDTSKTATDTEIAPTKSTSIVSDIETNPSQSNSPRQFSAKLAPTNNHTRKTSVSKLNVNAQEFIFNPAKSSFAPMFTFGERSPAVAPSTASISFEGNHSKNTSNTSVFSPGLNVEAPPFVPGKPVEISTSRVFSFSSAVPTLKPDAPEFTPGSAFGEIPGGLMDKRSNAGRVFSYGDMIQIPKKSKAVAIIPPDTEDETHEDEEGRITQAEGRQKRMRREGGSGDETPLFATHHDDRITPEVSIEDKKSDKSSSVDIKASTPPPAVPQDDDKALEDDRNAHELPDNITSLDSTRDTISSRTDNEDHGSINEVPVKSDATDLADLQGDATESAQSAQAPSESSPEISQQPEVKIPSISETADYTIAKSPIAELHKVSHESLEAEKPHVSEEEVLDQKSSALAPPEPLQYIPTASSLGTDTALNTADFLSTPSNLASPFPSEVTDTQSPNDLVAETKDIPKIDVIRHGTSALDDPFTVGEHEDENHTDKSATELETVSVKKEPPMIEVRKQSASDDTKERDTIGTLPTVNANLVEKKTPGLSAKAKPFVFNPAVTVFKPETSTIPAFGLSKIGRPDVPEFVPSAAQPMLKSQTDLPSPEQAPPHPTIDMITALKQEPPKKPAFSGGLGASRYASEEPAILARKPTPAPAPAPLPESLDASTADLPDSARETKTSSPPTQSDITEAVPRRRVSSPELSPFASDERKSVSEKQYSRPVTPTKVPLAERIANGVHYVEPSFKEIDDVMKQLNGDDSDLGVERDLEQVWKSPKRNAREEVSVPVRVATPLSQRLRASLSRLPTSSPNQLDRPFQYLPEQDYGSSNSEDSRRRDAAAEYAARNARYSPSYKGPHHSEPVEEVSPVHQLNRKTSGSVSNWDDIVSDDEVADFHGRVGFFGNRVKHVIGNAIDDRLQPIESTLAKVSSTLAKMDNRSRSSRPRRSRSLESDADDEDDEVEAVRAVSPLLKDRRFEKLKSILLEVISHQDSNRTRHDDSAINELSQAVSEIKTNLASRPSTTAADNSTQVVDAISELKTFLASQSSRAVTDDTLSATPFEDRLNGLTKMVTELQNSFATHRDSQSQSIKTVMEEALEKHADAKAAAVVSGEGSMTVEKLQLQVAGLEDMLKAADDRTTEENRLRRDVEDQLAERERELKSAIIEATQERETAEETEASLRTILNDHQQSKQHNAAMEEVKIALQNKLAEGEDKTRALEEAIAEYRTTHDDLRKDIDAAYAENEELSRSTMSLRDQLEDGIMSKQSLKLKFENIQKEMVAATHGMARDQAAWRHKDEEHKAKHELAAARLEAEARTRERLELEIDRLEKQEREAMKARTLVEDIRSQNGNLTNMVNDLRSKAHHFQERSMSFERELHDAKERSRLEIQRLIGNTKNDIEAASQQTQIVRADLEGIIHRLEEQVTHLQTDAKSAKDRYQSMLEEASVSKDNALREAAEAREAALQEHYRFHERTMHEMQVSHERTVSELKKDHSRVSGNLHDDHQRAIHNMVEDHKTALGNAIQEKRISVQELDGRLALSEDRNLHLQEKVRHLEERLAISNTAAQAAAEAAKSARKSSSASPAGRVIAPSLRGFDPQALRQTVETLQDQLGERERQIETLRTELEEIDKDAPNKVKERDAEITWLRELLGVRMDDMQDIIVQLSTPHFDRIAVRDAVIRLRANLQMEEQERERQLAGGAKFPSLADIRASPKALPLAAAAAWGSFARRGQSSLSTLAEMAVPSGSSSVDQTPSKSSPQSFLSGLLTPPSTNMRQTPRGRASLSRPTSSSQRPRASFSTPKRQISIDHSARNQQVIASDIPETPALLTKAAYDADAPEGPHHYSLDQYVSEEIDLPSEDTSQQGDSDSTTIVTNERASTTSNPFGSSIELA